LSAGGRGKKSDEEEGEWLRWSVTKQLKRRSDWGKRLGGVRDSYLVEMGGGEGIEGQGENREENLIEKGNK